ncbi:LTA synthase family protein [Bacillus sp. FJAT-49736]|uniref:LTA synthase family protein n=1 Tax=Bacillus sp. FJAT-49736 TaxID=2833582 RepID=UPI001BCA4365|nr:LTA synthase family protein [Bacillus sp. FJAT-49736]MBS4173534.1 LTA synthase family protein [Bacillus sp. FJAT-49736]
MFRDRRESISLPIIAVFFLWIKTYIVYRTNFHLKIENLLQEAILLINPLGILLVVFGVCLFIKLENRRNKYIIFISFVVSLILYANIMFFRFFNDFITIPLLFQTSNFTDLTDSVYTEIKWWDIIFFMDPLLLLYFYKKNILVYPALYRLKNYRYIYFSIAFGMIVINLCLAEVARPQILTRTFDRKLLVQFLGAYNYQLYDLFLQSKSSAQKVWADGNKLIEIQHHVKSNYARPNENFFGLAKGRNLILISLESTQSFVIDSKVNGQEVTPFLNKFIQNSFYFPNIYHQTGQGKTSDAEFIVENSLYPLNRGAVFFTHTGNTYYSMARKLQDAGYFTAAMHANNKSFWNRNIMYKSFGYQKFFSSSSYKVMEYNSVGWGLKDIPFFEQSVELMKQIPQPFYVKMVTLTNHHPFRLMEEDKLIEEYQSEDPIVNRYFTTVRYEDEAIKKFIEKLKANGLYKQSIIVFYGDHHGISDNHTAAMSQYFGKKLTPFDTFNLQKVPFIIHIPGVTDKHKARSILTIGGQINIRPTLLHLLGLSTKNDVQFGQDLFSAAYKPFVIFRDGKFVTNDHIWTGNDCYVRNTGNVTDLQFCKPFIGKESKEFMFSDKVIYGDLLRFYIPHK